PTEVHELVQGAGTQTARRHLGHLAFLTPTRRPNTFFSPPLARRLSRYPQLSRKEPDTPTPRNSWNSISVNQRPSTSASFIAATASRWGRPAPYMYRVRSPAATPGRTGRCRRGRQGGTSGGGRRQDGAAPRTGHHAGHPVACGGGFPLDIAAVEHRSARSKNG